MNIISWKDFTENSFKISSPSSTTIGVFDGVHSGHYYLLNKLHEDFINERIVFTFLKNPLRLLKEKTFPGNILTLKQKLLALEKAGVTTTVLIDFSSDFSKLKGDYFINTIADHINLKKIVLGRDFKCGVNNSTTSFDILNILKEKDIQTVIVDRQKYKNIPVSSSDIRNMIISGNIGLVSELLPFGYSVDLTSTEIAENGDFFIAEKRNINQLLPESGSYKLNLVFENITSLTEVFIDNRNMKWYKK